ncbi:MAG: TonB-dependent receptor, partial [Acidobacteriia bacterium]|nr:TonB-dependent receptor [Terriglobia bacterium]
SENVALPLKTWHGKHEFAFGGGYSRRAFEGSSSSHPVQLLRSDGSLAERIGFSGSGKMSADDDEFVLFAQDHWEVSEDLAFDLGMRYLAESLGSGRNFAPRVGAVFFPKGNGKTVLRAGLGVFNNHAPLLAGDFSQNPVRSVTFFSPTGEVVGSPLVYQNLYEHLKDESGSFFSPTHTQTTPYNVTWSLEADRQLWPKATVRFSFLSSRSHNQFVVRPIPDSPTGPALVLSPTGATNYHEFESTLHLRPTAASEWNLSYVFSSARGNMNAFSQVYMPFEQPVIRPDAYSYLPADVPHRLITWGRFKTHLWGILASPLIDWHSGFHYSIVDEYQNYVGEPNRFRFPRFFSLDLKLSKEFHLPFPWIKKHLMRGSLAILNVTNNSNPRDVYNNVTSPFFGHFVGLQHRFLDTNLTILY